MTRPAKQSDDKLIMQVRRALKDMEPRELPTKTQRNPYGFECWVCPYCGQLCHKRSPFARGRDNPHYGQYNMHFAHAHATPFWLEKHIIALFQ